MSVLTEFYTLADPVFSGRAYRNHAGDNPVVPYATFFRVVAVEGATLDDNGGTGNEEATQIQLDVYGNSGAQVDNLVGTMKAALKGWSVPNVITSEGDMYEPDTKLHRVMLTIETLQ